MRTIFKPRAPGPWLSLLLLCSCAIMRDPSAVIPASELPADVTMNQDAGRGNFLIVTLRLESGEELPFVVDTGAGRTLLDRSLEPKLGRRLRSSAVSLFGIEHETGLYAAPKLYLGNTRLMTGGDIATYDVKQMLPRSSRPIMGILGMDCLRHYRIQLDFETGKMRFLGADQVNAAELGQPFPLASSDDAIGWTDDCPVIHQGGLIGGTGTNLLIDTGCNIDGFLEAAAFRRQVGENSGVSISTNRAAGGLDSPHDNAFFREGVWRGGAYTNLYVGELPVRASNLIGLRFLARHLVTFDFPKRTVYLNQTSRGPLAGDSLVEMINDAIEPPAEFLQGLKEKANCPAGHKMMKAGFFVFFIMREIPIPKPSISKRMVFHPSIIMQLPGRPKKPLGSCKELGGRIKTVRLLKNLFPAEIDAHGLCQARSVIRFSQAKTTTDEPTVSILNLLVFILKSSTALPCVSHQNPGITQCSRPPI